MFTGIVQAVGRIASIENRDGDARIRVETGSLPLEGVKIGDSIAVNGVCLTAIALDAAAFSADVSRETLHRTTLGEAAPGARVNLELALTPTTRLGGHFVSGHVDGVGTVLRHRADARSWRVDIQAPDRLARYIAEKGSICVDGVSLTVNAVEGTVFGVNLVPHTVECTTFCELRQGRRVNLEVDLIARYLERLMLGERAAYPNGVTMDDLQRAGFVGDGC